MKHILAAALFASLAACTGDTGIVISDAEVRPPLPGRNMAAGYFEITNHGADDRLLSVSAPVSKKTEIHNHIEEDGVMKMRRVEGVVLATNQTITFKPGSYHVMMFETQLAAGQSDVALTFTFEKAKPMTVIADIDGADDTEDHSGH